MPWGGAQLPGLGPFAAARELRERLAPCVVPCTPAGATDQVAEGLRLLRRRGRALAKLI